MLSIIIPAYNEEKNIKNVLKNLFLSSIILKDKYEIIIVNDGSTDKTKEIINSLDNKKKLKILSLKKNVGFGKAFLYGLKKANGDRIVMIQGDNAWNSKNLKKLFQVYNDKNIDLLIQYNSKMLSTRGIVRTLLSKTFTKILNILTKKNIIYHNGIQVHQKKILNKIKIKEYHYCFQPEILLKTIKYYKNIKYIDMQSQEREYGFSKAFNIKNIKSVFIFFKKIYRIYND
jgi:glycosyltransferase involved in cell wall biosynthesis